MKKHLINIVLILLSFVYLVTTSGIAVELSSCCCINKNKIELYSIDKHECGICHMKVPAAGVHNGCSLYKQYSGFQSKSCKSEFLFLKYLPETIYQKTLAVFDLSVLNKAVTFFNKNETLKISIPVFKNTDDSPPLLSGINLIRFLHQFVVYFHPAF